MSPQLILLAALIGVSCGFIIPQTDDVKDRVISLKRPEGSVDPTILIVHNLLEGDTKVFTLKPLSEEDFVTPANRVRRQVKQDRPPVPGGQNGQIEVYGENRRRGGKDLGTDLSIQATGRLWESRNGQSSIDANANYQRHFGGPYGTSRPNYGGSINFNHRF